MFSLHNIKFSLLSAQDLSRLIIRKFLDKYIVGIVHSSPFFLHKRKRYREGGLFCERIFDFIYVCQNTRCTGILQFNENQIEKYICKKCNTVMQYNLKRNYRFGAILLDFPIINPIRFNDFMSILKLFKGTKYIDDLKIKFFFNLDYYDNKLINYFVHYKFVYSKFFNLLNIVNNLITSLELFKFKLGKIKRYNKLTHIDKLVIVNNFIDNILVFKELFIILFPVLPVSLREVPSYSKKFTLKNKLNWLYSYLLDTNAYALIHKPYNYNIKNIIRLYFLVDSILDNAAAKAVSPKDKTIYEKLPSKQGLFRQNLLGFRVDYSGRTVIVPGPYLSLKYIGLPINMISNILDRQFLLNEDLEYEHDESEDEEDLIEEEPKLTKYAYKRYLACKEDDKTDNKDMINELLLYESSIFNKILYVDYLNEYSITVNRAPTLHKMNVQSFCPIVSEGESIKLSILACAGYNADFDGDIMGIFTILEQSTILESINMMKALVNIYSPTTRKNIFNFSQGLIVGSYTLLIYNFCNLFNSYVIEDYYCLLESYAIKSIFVDYPVFLRSFNYIYLTTLGRVLCNINTCDK